MPIFPPNSACISLTLLLLALPGYPPPIGTQLLYLSFRSNQYFTIVYHYCQPFTEKIEEMEARSLYGD
jgi:hypothetical protein